MECNKDEAVRAKQLAESRMQKGQFAEALKFANKAKKLYADVDNIAQIFAICEVHIAALNKLSCSEMDWYRILQTERLSEEAIIKKQYRKLALLLHPDKNKFAGAEAAFKLIGEANRVLSDQAKRSLHDMKVKAHARAAVPKPSSCHSNGNVFAANQVPNATKSQNKSSSNFPSRNPHLNAQLTFWTMCQHCNTRFQYYFNYVNMTLRCRNCEKSFVAYATSQPAAPSFVPFVSSKMPPMQAPPKPASKSNGGKPPGGGYADTFMRSYPSYMKTCATGVGKEHKDEKSKVGYVPVSKPMESQASKNVGSKRVRQPDPGSKQRFNTRNVDENTDVNVQENHADPSRLNVRRSSRQKQHVSYVETYADDNFDVPSKKPRQNESFNIDEVEEKNVSEDTVLSNTSGDKHSDLQEDKVSESDIDSKMLNEENCSPPNSNIPSSPEIITCPDPDFNNFENDKADDCFAANQLWAIYDNTDAMPRFYALIKKVTFPFKLHITWLEADPDEDDEDDEVAWYNADLPIACGKFKLANSQRTTDRGMFSHQMQFIKGNNKDSYLVFPKKGETWAIFRNWDIKWSYNPENYLKREFAYVEILSDFIENVGIEVAYLGKVNGFVSLFEKTGKNGENTFCILPNELYRFSHQIPSYKMSGNEREGVPRGCFELDPAALPTEIFEAEKDSREKV
ncbi:chaperone protein dnaJ [Trifolium pratense]|uniref:Chaperone protein dnaJ n=2 Tax=Trifolium pratense TaxID=57577 RepID=A0A2K3PGU4_TRIPR|nr:chaperone protein dnaJ [Trifolium pratense]